MIADTGIGQSMLFIFLAAYLLLLLGIAWWGAQAEQGSRWMNLTHSRWVYTLSLSVYCTSWTYFGIVGSASLSGGLYLAIFWGSILAFFFSSVLLRRMIAVKNLYRVTSIADFLSARYFRSQSIAALVSIMAVVGVMPYIALQLKAINNSFELISQNSASVMNEWIPIGSASFMVLFTILFGLRHLDTTERHPGVVLAMALESLVKLLAFICAGLLVTYGLFDGFGDIFSQAEALRQTEARFQGYQSTPTFVQWICYLLISASAIFFLPRQFHLAVVENSDPNHVRTAQWGLPFYLFLILLFVIPISLGGLIMGYSPQQADTFVLLLPLQTNSPWLSLFVFIGGFSAAMGMIVISAMSMSVMFTNHLLLPVLEVTPGLKWLRRHLLKLRWLAVALFLFISYQFNAHVGESYMLASMGILSFVAVLQFAPAALGGLFWRKASKVGAFTGLLLGFLMWCYTLLLPALMKSGWLTFPWLQSQIMTSWLNPEAFMGLEGLDSISHGVIWTLIFNVTGYLFFSLLFPGNQEEHDYNQEFTEVLQQEISEQPSIELPHNIFLPNKIGLVKALLEEYLQHHEAQELLQQALESLGLSEQSYVTLMDLNRFHKEISHRLSGSIGAASAYKALSRVNLITQSEQEAIRNLYTDILNQLNISPHELQAKISYYQERENLIVRHSEEQAETIQLLKEQMSERAKAESARIETEHRLQAILDHAPSVIYMKDLEGRYLLVNREFCRIFNLPLNEVIGKNDFDIFSEESARLFQANDLAVVASKQPQESEEVAHHIDGIHTYISMKFPIFNDQNEVIASGGVSTDISDRKASEDQLLRFNQALEEKVKLRTQRLEESNSALQKTLQNLKATQDQLIEAEKMASLGSLVAGVAHEINTPVGIGVTAASAMLQATTDLILKIEAESLTRSDLEDYLDLSQESNSLVLSNLQRAAELVRTFKQVAVDQSAEDLREFILDQYIQDLIASLKPVLSNVQVEVNCPENIVMFSYPGALAQVITNMITNAIDHGFNAREQYSPDNKVNITINLLSESELNLTFSDNGKGVPKEILGRIFEPFVTTARGKGGSGLGAHIIYNLVTRKLRGHIKAESREGEGLTLYIQIPLDVRELDDFSDTTFFEI
ncbi:PAS domain S-box-containing protein [Oceanospirillum multiglobuliferum]|uniref:histidine kinase n=1 Tax=Oceanospirillum multiglobuliferum TaxID=64969 RepID=A0A1T4Q1D4_9GAMM|nr:ATP-binding protein [Oceanospirillum multiglobuliferum]OPX55462.1 hypothetical protein BTE48_08725 [Oceanospirillum multiglobuliferum]SJZ97347.1 PAS domain S-box-containing protein [Oceanospirillum multiglobuliferum]